MQNRRGEASTTYILCMHATMSVYLYFCWVKVTLDMKLSYLPIGIDKKIHSRLQP